ncbi:WD40 repeat domain-containing protein [Candidatus Dependentiae bacterium]|nr:WD40 repeat domain-containing protein [Candidatus Dependentiae bacterium]
MAKKSKSTAYFVSATSGKRLSSLKKTEEAIVTAAAFNSTGNTFLAGFSDGALILYGSNVENKNDISTVLWRTEKNIRTLFSKEDHNKILGNSTNAVTSVLFRPDESIIFTGFADGTAALVKSSTGDFLTKFIKNYQYITTAAFSSNGKVLIIGLSNGKVIILDTTKKNFELEYKNLELKQHKKPICSLALSQDNTTIISCSEEAPGLIMICFWCFATGKQLRIINKKLPAAVNCVTLRSDCTAILMELSNGMIYSYPLHDDMKLAGSLAIENIMLLTPSLYSLKSKEHQRSQLSLKGHDQSITTVACGDKALITGSKDGTVRLWDPVSGTLLKTIKDSSGPINSLTIVNDAHHKALRYYDASTKKQLRLLDEQEADVQKITVSPAKNGKIQIQDHYTGNELKIVNPEISLVAMSPHDNLFLFTKSDSLKIFLCYAA